MRRWWEPRWEFSESHRRVKSTAQLSSSLLTEVWFSASENNAVYRVFWQPLLKSEPHFCPCLCNTGSWDGLHEGLKEFCTEPVLPESRKELCPTSLNLSTDSSTASQAMKFPLVSSLQSQSTFRRLSRQGLTNNSRKQKLLLQRKKPLNSKSIKILLNIVVPLSNLGEGSFRGLWAGEDTVCVPWSAWS